MLVVFPFCARDKAQAVRLAEWIAKLGGVGKHDCLLAVHKDTDSEGVIEPLTGAFGRIAEFAITDEMIVEREQHAYAANLMWKRTVNHVAEMNESQPWLWMEADAVPTKASWLDDISGAYAACGKPFLHDLVKTARGKSNSGCGVYPSKVRDYTSRLWELADVSWDVLLYEDFARHTAYTPLIQDMGFLEDGKTMPTFLDAASLSIIRPEAVLFHRCKDGTLIDRLSGKDETRSAPAPAGDRRLTESASPVEPSLGAGAPPSREEELLARIARLEALLKPNGGDEPCATSSPKAPSKLTAPASNMTGTSATVASKAAPTSKPAARRKTKAKRHVSPERRAQLAATLAKARAAKKKATA